MLIRVIFFLIILTSSVLAKCKDYSNLSNNLVKNLQVEVYKEQKFVKHISKFYLSKQKGEPLTNFNKKKKYDARITINYNDGNHCTYEAKLRMHGDAVDHIDLVNGIPTSSLNVQLKEGNIQNITKFILFRPNSRAYANEIFAANLFSHLGFLSPRTFKIKVKIFNNESEFIFQESLKKEFLEHAKRVEAPILETKEDNVLLFSMAKVSNKEWIKENKNKYIVSLNAIQEYNLSLLKSYQSKLSGAMDKIVSFDPRDFDEDVFKQIAIFDAIMYAIGGTHGLNNFNRRFYYDPTYSKLEPIYYDGDVNILSIIGYDRYSDKFKKNLESWKIIKKPFLNFYSNQNRTPYEINRNPTVTNSAKKGANLAILKLKDINSLALLKKLNSNGLHDISVEKLDLLIGHIIKRLELIAKAKVYEEKIILEKFLYFYYKDEMNQKNDVNLFFIDNQYSLSDKKEILIEECNYSLILCESYLINEKQLIKLIEQKKLGLNKSVFINFDKNDFKNGKIEKSKNNIKNNFTIFKVNESIKILINKDVEILFDKINKIIDLNYLTNNGRAIIFESKIDSWSIRMHNLSNETNVKFDNINNLTGCLTIIDTLLDKVDILGEGFNCEDTVNFIRSSGSLNSIQIKNSKSDSLDADFSQLKFNLVDIKNSNNDCIDFSYGDYEVKDANLNNCGDKAISVGEKSKATFNNIKIQKSNIGVAAKDSSKVYINVANMKKLKVCLSAYKKKQEFNGSFLEVKNLSCETFDKKYEKDNISSLIVKNEL